jgi:hypothetical protein
VPVLHFILTFLVFWICASHKSITEKGLFYSFVLLWECTSIYYETQNRLCKSLFAKGNRDRLLAATEFIGTNSEASISKAAYFQLMETYTRIPDLCRAGQILVRLWHGIRLNPPELSSNLRCGRKHELNYCAECPNISSIDLEKRRQYGMAFQNLVNKLSSNFSTYANHTAITAKG